MKVVRIPISLLSAVALLLPPACGGGGETPSGPGGEGNSTPEGPDFDLSGIQLVADEDSTLTESLSGVLSNGDLDSITVDAGSSKIQQMALSGTDLTITPVADANGTFRLRLWASNAETSGSAALDGEFRPRTDLRFGRLVNHLGASRTGRLRIYEATEEGSPGQLIVELESDGQGSFEQVQLPNHSAYAVRARIFQDGEPASFVRTIHAHPSPLGADIDTNEEVLVEGYEELAVNGWTPEEYQRYLYDPEDIDGDDITGVQCCMDDPLRGNTASRVYIERDSPNGRIPENVQQFLEQRIEDPNDVPKLFGRQFDEIVIGTGDDDNPYTVDPEDNFDTVEKGWVVIWPDTTLNHTAATGAPKDVDQDGELDSGVIVLGIPLDISSEGPRNGLDYLISHEFGHVAGLEHASMEAAQAGKTIMFRANPPGTPTVPAYADIRAARSDRTYTDLEIDLLDVYGLEF